MTGRPDILGYLGPRLARGAVIGLSPAGLAATWWAAMQDYSSQIAANPSNWIPYVQSFVGNMEAVETSLARMRQQLHELELIASQTGQPLSPLHQEVRQWRLTTARYETRFRALADGFLSRVKLPEGQNQNQALGAAPVVVVAVVAGVGLSIGAIAWAYVSHQESSALRDSLKLRADELQARVDAAKRGYQLSPSTLPDRLFNQADKWQKYLSWGATIGFVGLGVWLELNRRRR